ncbi:TerB family tellurite resistance protein [Pseudanabaena sp. FACHB-2040]|uniref:tellurite resistance TerB family protein n=1 Tax=Pseudanabaena sp. FACHB-2040 TaxID=2692859 RepID=UPI001686CE63|nr:TerB family tellurite resistance protein [Pseudanabaena sp. FACHB-2040]MBD2257135.1 TerB family tellurite resistance protein [Pseudanabaena sp. FACHB-2040]
MTLQPPPPPSISPRQMTLMRIVASLAWSDGNLATEEVNLMLDRFSSLFSVTAERQQILRQELQDYLMQNIPLEELVPKLPAQEEREVVLQLAYEVISASARAPEEPVINPEEEAAYQRLVALLDLPTSVVEKVEQEAKADLQQPQNIVDRMTDRLRRFIEHP